MGESDPSNDNPSFSRKLLWIGLPLLVLIGVVVASTAVFHPMSLVWSPSLSKDDHQELLQLPLGLPKRRITMIIGLAGRLGNQLMFLSHAYALKLWMDEQVPNITIDLVGEHQKDCPESWWRKVTTEITTCFPNLRHLDVSSGVFDTTGEFQQREQTLRSWLSTRQSSHTLSVLDVDNNPDLAAKVLKELLEQQELEPSNLDIQEPLNATISLPYLRVHQMQVHNPLVEQYRAQIQQWLAFDFGACCRILPDYEEVVFHFRNFAAGSATNVQHGYVEVGPKHVVPLLLDNIGNATTTKIRFVTGNPTHPVAIQHIQEILTSNKLYLRVATGQSGVQDFCLLLQAKHVVATQESSFALMAGILGNQSTVNLYIVNATETIKRKAYLFQPENWMWKGKEDPTLRQRFRHVYYPEEYRY